MSVALVTGASGFTGRYMVDALRQGGFDVVGVGSKPVVGCRMVACDLTDAQAVKSLVAEVRPDWVVHLAALSFVGHADQHAFYDVNVFGTLNLLQAIREAKCCVARILIASSANIYGTPNVSQIDESICPAPVNHYACSKLAMEHLVLTGFADLPLVITRPFNYTGPGQDNRFLIPKIVEHFARGDDVIELGNIDVSRDFSDVRDVISAYMGLLASDSVGQVVNICSGKDTSLRSVIEQMNALAGYEITVKVNPAFVRANEIPKLCGVNRRLADLTGWQPEFVLSTTLRDMFAFSRSNHGLLVS